MILVFSRTTGFRHDSIPAGVALMTGLGKAEATEDETAFTPENLARFRAVVFMNTNGAVLDDPGRAAFEAYIRGGGGFLGVHSASATEYDWPFYGDLVGAYFNGHPPTQPGVAVVADPNHPATADLPARWAWTDEWYEFRRYPDARVLLRADESSYEGGSMGADHPLAWCHERLGGRALYTALGHTIEGYANPTFRAHLTGALRWVLGEDQ